MRIATRSERVAVISDLHIGNPFSQARRQLDGFLEFCRHERFDLCINGDGFEILQSSFAALARDSLSVLRHLKRFTSDGLRVFYVVGNHDIALENLLTANDDYFICPFLNLRSGDKRIRIEHGHLYDPSFVKHPVIYEALTRAAGPLLHVFPDSYKLWSRYQSLKDRWRKPREDGQAQSVYYEAADMILSRGFDTVVFGHTHHAETVELQPGQRYINSGTWMQGGHYVEIIDGNAQLRTWPN